VKADNNILANLETIVMNRRQRARAEEAVRASAVVVAMLLGVAQYVGFGASRTK
jgi:hypothetical protein